VHRHVGEKLLPGNALNNYLMNEVGKSGLVVKRNVVCESRGHIVVIFFCALVHTHTHPYTMHAGDETGGNGCHVGWQCGASLTLFLLKFSFHDWNTCQFHR
jgi:hypothetical protein